MHTKIARKTVDRSQETLPPLWMQHSHTDQPRTERPSQAPLFQTGQARLAASRAIEMIDSAREVVVVCSFLLSDPEVLVALERATSNAVRVYVMLAAESRLLSEPPEVDQSGLAEWKRRVLAEFKGTLQRLGGRALIRASDQFHAKVVLVDPTTCPQGMLLTANLNSEPLERNQELAVELAEPEVRDIYSVIRWAFWEAASHEIINPKDSGMSAIRSLGEIEHPDALPHCLCTTSSSTSIREAFLAAIESESQEIVVSCYGWDQNHAVVRALVEKARAGVAVTIFARPRAAAMPALLDLVTAGAKVMGFKYLHAKAIWISSGCGIMTSANLEPHGLDSGFELGVRLSDECTKALGQVFDEWRNTAEWELRTDARCGEISGPIQLWQENNLVAAEVVSEICLSVHKRDVPSAELLDDAEPAEYQEPLPWAHRVVIEGEVVAPTLHPKAKEQFKKVNGRDGKTRKEPYSPRVYMQQGKLVVAIRSRNELPEAQNLRRELKAVAIVFDGASG